MQYHNNHGGINYYYLYSHDYNDCMLLYNNNTIITIYPPHTHEVTKLYIWGSWSLIYLHKTIMWYYYTKRILIRNVD